VARPAETLVLHEDYDVPDRQALVWADAMLHDEEVDIQRREALAREHRQETLSLALTAQAALLVRLRAKLHSRYWAVRNGNVPKGE
jgi:hypothetical protein